MNSESPSTIFLFSGKRKSGKDFITELLHERLGKDKSVIIRVSGPIKHEYALAHDLDQDELFSASSYKENYRKAMITWSEEIRNQKYDYFLKAALKMYDAFNYPVWIVSDVRRRTDIKWFEETYPERVCSIRIQASEKTRGDRGFVFMPGVDDAASECDLDFFDRWEFTFENDSTDTMQIEDFLQKLVLRCQGQMS